VANWQALEAHAWSPNHGKLLWQTPHSSAMGPEMTGKTWLDMVGRLLVDHKVSLVVGNGVPCFEKTGRSVDGGRKKIDDHTQRLHLETSRRRPSVGTRGLSCEAKVRSGLTATDEGPLAVEPSHNKRSRPGARK